MEPVEVLIPRHAVPSHPVTGLSPLQAAMTDDPAPIRIFSAPTGAGKSYAFQLAMRDRGARILFIVPTKRLAQNIAQGLIGDLVDSGWDPAEVRGRVAIWSSDERKRLEEESPGIRIPKLRLGQLRDDGGPKGRGMMIVATQESVVHLLLGRSRTEGGMDPQSVLDLLRLDHVVIDEFHTVDARGMGLACAISSITPLIGGGARLTFLSATPIDVRSTLIGFGVDPAHISVREEEVVTGGPGETVGMRAIHGDVRLRLEPSEDMVGGLSRHEALIRETLERTDKGSQVVIIYDSLKRLLSDKGALADFLDRIGVGASERLVINSMDDSVERWEDGRFTLGHLNDPMRFRVLIATSSVEMGVTFRAGLILMEPGHDPCSFVQRIGRVARGDLPGTVVVTFSRNQVERMGWLRAIRTELQNGPPERPVGEFVRALLRGTRERFDLSGEDLEAESGDFRKMPQTAMWCAALFWVAMEGAEWRSVIRGSFREFRPRKAARMGAMIGQLQRSRNRATRAWAEAILREAKTLRVIVEKVVLVEPSGLSKSIPWHLYASTPELVDAPSYLDERDHLRVRVSRPIAEIEAALGGLRVRRREEALTPHQEMTLMVEAERAKDDWCRQMERVLSGPGLTDADREAIGTAITIVRLTGIVPIHKGLHGAENGIL